ncbi:hypothetical protein C5E11_12980 [Clavibacter michiganensis]|nr:hypothetical protein C5E11_12980 [Clavibacter michiganensis]
MHTGKRHALPHGEDRATDRPAALGGLGAIGPSRAFLADLSPDAAVRHEDLVDRVCDPELLEGPGDEKGGDSGVFVRSRHEEVAQLLHGGALEATEVAEQMNRVGRELRGLVGLELELGAQSAASRCGESPHVEARTRSCVCGCHESPADWSKTCVRKRRREEQTNLTPWL